MQTIDITPTWNGVLPWIIAGIEAGGTALSSAELELRNMAKLADRWNACAPGLVEALEALIPDLVCTIQEVADNNGSPEWLAKARDRLAAANAAIAKAKEA